MQSLLDKWHYHGNVNVEYGGVFMDLSDWQWGYVNATRVTDLGSGCGARGMVLIEKITINGTDDTRRVREALECCGWTFKDVMACRGSTGKRMMIAYALMSYGYYDPSDGYHSPSSITLQTEQGAPMKYDGWRAEKFVACSDLKGYIESEWLD